MSGGPKEGIYLDATLAVIGEQIEERIDELVSRRRLRTRWAIGILSVFALASSSVAAVAVSTALLVAQAPTDPVAATVSYELRCVAGAEPAAPAYFTAGFVAAPDIEIDDVDACIRARDDVRAGGSELTEASPEVLVSVAEDLLSVGAHGEIRVTDASFRTVDDGSTPAAVSICTDATGTTILFADTEAAVPGCERIAP